MTCTCKSSHLANCRENVSVLCQHQNLEILKCNGLTVSMNDNYCSLITRPKIKVNAMDHHQNSLEEIPESSAFQLLEVGRNEKT